MFTSYPLPIEIRTPFGLFSPVMPHHHHDRHFTLSEAQALLPKIRKKIEAIMKAKRAVDARQAGTAHAENGNGNGKHADPLKILTQLAQELADEGILLKDADRGLIDFPHLREDGEEVYLCWLSGEKEILYWHRIEDGFAGRQPISEL